MANEVGWFHTKDESDSWDGFNDSGIATFAGHPIKSLAREVIQNALDAGEDDTVLVEIKLHKVLTKSIPNFNNFFATMEACRIASKEEGYKAQVFFDNAIKILSKKHIPVLEVSDYNTSGMKGPCNNGSPYFAFMKATGQSKKQDSTAGGSWGIGKFAPYAVSNLRTLFVSTIFETDNGKKNQYTQGKSILMSHDVSSERYRGVGFWGIKQGCQPIQGKSNDIPDWIFRSKNEGSLASNAGSKLSILGFNEESYWRELLAITIVENFFGAIIRDKLSINIDDKYLINKKTIDDIFEKREIIDCIEDMKDKEAKNSFFNSKEYLRVLGNDSSVYEGRSQQPELGLCRIRIIIGEKLPRKVSVLRNGMLITDSLTGLKSFSNFKEFIAVVECLSPEGNALLREMEPPKHDDFEPERLVTEKDKKKGKKALRNLSIWVREMLKRYAKDPVSERTELDELKDFFGDDTSEDRSSGDQEINPFGSLQIRARPIKTITQGTNSFDSVTGRGSESDKSDGSSKKNTKSSAGNAGSKGLQGGGSGSGDKGSKLIANDIRSIIRSENIRTIYLTPTISGKTKFKLKAAGADSDYDLQILESSEGSIENGCVISDVESGKRISLDLKIKNNFTGAIKVFAYEI